MSLPLDCAASRPSFPTAFNRVSISASNNKLSNPDAEAQDKKNAEVARDMAVLTLTKIYNGGIRDVVGGGFARYSVDERWHVPHCE